jgi:hypothetical protein
MPERMKLEQRVGGHAHPLFCASALRSLLTFKSPGVGRISGRYLIVAKFPCKK